MRAKVVSITILAISLQGGSAKALDSLDGVDGVREVGERMASECLSGDSQIVCLNKKGFRCASVGEPSRTSYSCYISLSSGCYRTRFQLEENGWSSNDQWTSGACEETFEPVLEPGVRKRFDNTNAPVELVFEMFVRDIFAETLHYRDSLDALDDEPHHAGYHYVEPGLTGKLESADVVRYFAERFISIEQEVEDLSKKLLCEGKRPRYDGAENFQIFNQLDDVKLHVYERHLLLARADLQVSGLFDLDKALREYPGSFVSIFSDHEAARNGSIPMIYEHATRLCDNPWEHNFSSSRQMSESE